MMIVKTLFALFAFALLPIKGYSQTAQSKQTEQSAMMALPPFERAVLITKFHEGMHRGKWPYVGFGHRVQPGEHLSPDMTEWEADSLLRSDLRKLCRLFRDYGKDSLLLACVSFNVGYGKVVGIGKYKPSRLIQKLRQGRRDIEAEYMDFCRWKGRVIPSIKRRRWAELHFLYTR